MICYWPGCEATATTLFASTTEPPSAPIPHLEVLCEAHSITHRLILTRHHLVAASWTLMATHEI